MRVHYIEMRHSYYITLHFYFLDAQGVNESQRNKYQMKYNILIAVACYFCDLSAHKLNTLRCTLHEQRKCSFLLICQLQNLHIIFELYFSFIY